MWDFEASKAVAGLFLVFLACLQSIPGGVLSESDRKTETHVSDNFVKASNLVIFTCLYTAVIVACSEALGTSTLHTPWTTPQVIYFLLGIVGGLLRLWSINIMKQHFTFSVGIVKDHKLVQSGPYRYIRHPGYTGALVSFFGMWAFLGLRPLSLLWWLLYAAPFTMIMVRRIPEEEATLHQHFGKEYKDYCRRTWRLLPPIF